MDGHAFSLFASPDVDELVVPDCAGGAYIFAMFPHFPRALLLLCYAVDEHTLVTCLSQCFSLTRIELGHCGTSFDCVVAKYLYLNISSFIYRSMFDRSGSQDAITCLCHGTLGAPVYWRLLHGMMMV
jgi:hypothetical protein